MSKKINQLTAATDAEAINDSYLFPLADPVNGVALKTSVAQAKEIFKVKKLKYVCNGLEGTTLTLSQLAGKDIMLIIRGMSPIYESTDGTPETDEYEWDTVNITLGAATNQLEKFIILYNNL